MRPAARQIADTSLKAFRSADHASARVRVLWLLRAFGSATHEQLIARTAGTLTPEAVRGSCADLVRRGVVRFSGRYATNSRGRLVKVWEVCNA